MSTIMSTILFNSQFKQQHCFFYYTRIPTRIIAACGYMIHSKVVTSTKEFENYNFIKFIFIDTHCVLTTVLKGTLSTQVHTSTWQNT